jgi:hypothetical protein
VRERQSGVNWWLVLILVPAVVLPLYLRFRDEEQPHIAAAFVVGGVLLVLVPMLLIRRMRIRQVVEMEQTGVFRIDMNVSFRSFPGDGAERARQSLPMRGFNYRELPAVLTVEGDALVVTSKAHGSGKQPFRATRPLGDIADIEVSRTSVSIVGSTLVVRFRDGPDLTAHLVVNPDLGQRVADQLLLHASGRGRRQVG